MSALKTILRAVGRVLANVVVPFLFVRGKAAVLAGRRVGAWWLRTFRARGGRGKLLFGVGSLVAACLLCSIPVAIFAPAATPRRVQKR